tara:strand:+ start:1643 stop:1891 length:249 start_codon:yes stop_codon:yes gene_type:complete
MSKINFNEFAKKTIIALKEIEYDLKECDYSIEEWSAFLREELEGEYHAEEEEEAFFLRSAENAFYEDSLTYETLEALWKDKE